MRQILIFTTPRPHNEEQYAIIQTNALTSWKFLPGYIPNPYLVDSCKDVRIAVFGDEEHEGEPVSFARKLGYEIEPVPERAPSGVPLVSAMFRRAREMVGDDGVPCYVNADIILEQDLIAALQRGAESFPRGNWRKALFVARRYNVQMLGRMGFAPGWEAVLKDKVDLQGSKMVECAIDLFAWTGDLFINPPFQPFRVGRYTWDNALCGHALRQAAALVDITNVVRITHQQHHNRAWEEEDCVANRNLPHCLNALHDCTHTLLPEGLVEGWRG